MKEVILVGSRTTLERQARGTGLTLWSRSEPSGWERLSELALTNPSWLTPGPPELVYVLHGDGTQVSTIRIGADGSLKVVATIDCGGTNPVHAVVVGDQLLIANYASGTVSRLSIRADGTPAEPDSIIDLNFAIAGATSTAESHPHQILVADDGRCAYVPDKGLDAIFVIDLEQTELVVLGYSTYESGVGPRHAAFDPTRRDRMYLVGEIDSTLRTCEITERSSISQIAVSATLPQAVSRSDSTAAGIVTRATNQGTKIWVSNRGHDSISEFSLDGDGLPVLERIHPCNGRFPRFISEVDGQLIIAHENSDSISTSNISRQTGQLTRPTTVARTGSPVCVITTEVQSCD